MLDINLFRNDIAGRRHRPRAARHRRSTPLASRRSSASARTSRRARRICRRSATRCRSEIGAAKGKGEDASALLTRWPGIGDETKRLEVELDRVQAQLRDFLLDLPNLAHASTPVGKAADDNVEVRRWGTPRTFDFPVRDHTDIGEGLGLLDFATAAKLSGARFSFLRGELARLHRALGAVHARHADARTRLHRMLYALHRQCRNADRHDPAAEVRGRHVLGEEGGRRRRGRDRSTSSRPPRSR